MDTQVKVCKRHRKLNVAKDYKLGALVWAKMRGYSPWPAQVSYPTDGKLPKSKQPQHYVYFYGTDNFAWILDYHIVPHSEEMLANSRRYKKISSSMQSAIQEIEWASKKPKYKSKLLATDTIKKEPASSPLPARGTLKGKGMRKKIMQPKRIGQRCAAKFKLLSKNKIKKEPLSSPPPTPEKPKTPKKKAICKKIKQPIRASQRNIKQFKLLTNDEIKKEPSSSPPSTPEKPKALERKAMPKKIMKPKRIGQRCTEKLLLKNKIKKEPLSSPPPIPEKPKTPKKKAVSKKIMQPVRTSQRRAEKFKLLTKQEIKKESGNTSEKTTKKKVNPKKIIEKKSTKVEKTELRLKKKDIKIYKESSKIKKISAKKRSASNAMCNGSKKVKAKNNEDSEKDYLTLIGNLTRINAYSNVASTEKQRTRDISASYQFANERLNELTEENLEEYADLPTNNEYSNVAAIPPYNDDPIEGTSRTVVSGYVTATSKEIGFLGIGKIGYQLVNCLLNTEHSVTIWNRSPSEECEDLVKKGAKFADFPYDVIRDCDITFCCVYDKIAVQNVVFMTGGVAAGFEDFGGNKAYVELTTIDPETSQDISNAIVGNGGRYLNAPMLGTREDAAKKSMVIVAAGDRGVFNECNSIFASWGRAMYKGLDAGYASKLNLLLTMLAGTSFVVLGEILAMVERIGINPNYFMEIASMGPMNFPVLMNKGRAMATNDSTVHIPVKNMQKDMDLAVSLGHSVEQPLAVAGAANEVYKRMKYSNGESDVSILHECYKI